MKRDWLRWDEALVLDLLEAKPLGMFALNLVEESGGTLKRGSIYMTLSRMNDAGWVVWIPEEHQSQGCYARPLYRITPRGSSARVTLERRPRPRLELGWALILMAWAMLITAWVLWWLLP